MIEQVDREAYPPEWCETVARALAEEAREGGDFHEDADIAIRALAPLAEQAMVARIVKFTSQINGDGRVIAKMIAKEFHP